MALIRDRIAGTPVFSGNELGINWEGAEICMTVEETFPEGLVMIGHNTHVYPVKTRDLTYSQIGGLAEELQKIKEMIRIPLF